MRRFFLPIAILVLLASIAAPVSASVRSVVNRKAAARGTGEVKLRARAESQYTTPCMDCGYGWWVDVMEVIRGPPLAGKLLVFLRGTIVGPCSPGGYIDWSIRPGDEVEAFGLLLADPWLGLHVSLCGSDDYYLRRVTTGPTLTPTNTATPTRRKTPTGTSTPTLTRTRRPTITPGPTPTHTRRPIGTYRVYLPVITKS
jgi:hypothetical protein